MAESGFARQAREAKAVRTASKSAARGLPAMLVVIAAIVSLTFAFRGQESGELRNWYLNQARQAIQEDDWEAAEVLSRKLVQMRPDDDLGRYFLALCMEAGGDRERAERLMDEIAPPDSLRLDLAHWWFVRHLTSSESMTADDFKSLRDHLLQFLRTHSHDTEARMLLGQVELAGGNIDAGLEEMSEAAGSSPDLQITVAQIAARLERTTMARSLGKMAVRRLQQQSDRDPANIELRLKLADALVMLGNFESASETLVAGLKREDGPQLRIALARLAVTTFDVLDDTPQKADFVVQQQTVLLTRVLPLVPRYQPLLKRLAQLSVDPADREGVATELLKPYLESGTAPAVVYMILGRDAIGRKDFDAAINHFGAACELQPDFPACLNNLAWSLIHCSQPDPQRAMDLIDEALLREPDRAEFHETRGQILVRLDRPAEAIPELRRGIEPTDSVTATHAVLSDAYAAISETELAAYFRESE